MPSGVYSVQEVAARIDLLGVSRCPRRGRYRMAALVATYGADASMTDVLRALSADCPRRAPETRLTELCGIHCPQMPAAFLPPAPSVVCFP